MMTFASEAGGQEGAKREFFISLRAFIDARYDGSR